MVTVLTAKLDGTEAIRYFPVSLVAFFLTEAALHAGVASKVPDEARRFKESLLAILFSSLCLEAFCNEMAENCLSKADRERVFGRKSGLSVAQRLQFLIQRQFSVNLTLDDPPLQRVRDLFRKRNALVHYKLEEAAGKAKVRSELQVIGAGSVTSIDLNAGPIWIQRPFVERVDALEAAVAYNTALRFLKFWNGKAAAPPDSPAGFEELLEPERESP